MFDRIKTKIVVLRLFYYLARLVFNFFRYGMIAKIDIFVY